jgi:hypothetical protein
MSAKSTALCIFLLVTSMWGQEGTRESALARNTRILNVSARHESQVPFFGAFGFPQCDKEGNLYFHLDEGDFTESALLLLSSDGQKGKILKFSGDHADLAFSTFFVSQEQGGAYVLAWKKRRFYLVGFDSHGDMRKPVALDLPEFVIPEDLVAFEDGSSLISGYYESRAPTELQGKAYTAIFESSGKLRKALSLNQPDVVLADVASNLREGGAALADDGNIYLLTPKDVLVLLKGGDFQKKIHFQKPDPQGVVTNFYVSGGFIVLAISSDTEKIMERRKFVVFDSSSGKLYAIYERPEELHRAQDVCFNREQGFTFMISDQGRTTLFTAPLR